MHAFECECPPVDEWRTDPYSDPMFIGLEDCEREWTAETSAFGPGDWSDPSRWQSEPDVGRVAHGVAARVDRLKAIGNGQVPQCAAMAFTLLADD
jgi:hypothetical protein